MASKSDRNAYALFVVATASSALLWWFGSGNTPVWWATWLAPLPVLVYAMRASRTAAAASAFLAWAIGGLNVWHYNQVVHLPLPIFALSIAGPALLFALATLLARSLAARGRIIAAAFSVPALLVSADYVNALTSPHGTFGNLAYTQLDALPVIQIAALCGLWGITFLVLLLPAALAAWSSPQATRAAQRKLAALIIVSYAAALGYGGWRLQAATAETTSQVRIGLASLEGPARPLLSDPAGAKLLQRYLGVLEKLADAGATIVMMPETVFVTTSADIPELAEFARRRGVRVIAGVAYRGAGQPERNTALAFAADAAAPEQYNKHHLLPGFEDRYTPDTAFTSLASSPHTGLAICKDMDFPPMGRAYAERDTKLLLVPAWDFELDGWLHSRMAILRGVESGFALARTARDGSLTLSDDRGRVIGEASSTYIEDAASLLGDLPLRHSKTLYARWGDWFAWLCVVALVSCLGLLWMKPRLDAGMR